MAVYQPDARLAAKRVLSKKWALINASVSGGTVSVFKESKMDENKRDGKGFFPPPSQCRNHCSHTVIEKHGETSGWNSRSGTDKDPPSTRAICAASQPRLCVCLYIPLPPTKHR